jgi:E3 ubiquitin-protein ligase synoviolin
MEQSPHISRSFHVRMISLFTLLFAVDSLLLVYSWESILAYGATVMIMFASEVRHVCVDELSLPDCSLPVQYTILLATLVSTAIKYMLNVIDLRSSEPWPAKSLYTIYLDLALDLVKLVTYLAFFSLILTFYGLPLNTLRDVYLTLKSVVIKVRDLARLRAATRNSASVDSSLPALSIRS